LPTQRSGEGGGCSHALPATPKLREGGWECLVHLQGTRYEDGAHPPQAGYVLSTEGATFTVSPPEDGFAAANLRRRPRREDKKSASAESDSRPKPVCHGIETRLQRLAMAPNWAWGVAPGLNRRRRLWR
jgi:hypothetical protein